MLLILNPPFDIRDGVSGVNVNGDCRTVGYEEKVSA